MLIPPLANRAECYGVPIESPALTKRRTASGRVSGSGCSAAHSSIAATSAGCSQTKTRFGITLERMGYVRRANRTGRIERIGLKLLT
jgi:hypothetical protein